MKILNQLLDKWWFRIFLFLSFYLGYSYWTLFLSPSVFIENYYQFGSIFLILLSAFIENYRSHSKWYYFGLFNIFSKDNQRNYSLLFYSLISNIIIIYIFALLFGGKVKFGISNFGSVIILIYSMLFASLFEELSFRGVIFESIENRFGSIFSASITSLAFSAAHFFNPSFNALAFANTFLAGFMFSIIIINTRSILFSTFYHFSWNLSLSLLIGSPVSGISNKKSLLSVDFTNLPAFLFGSAYGLEDGVIVTFVLIFNIILLSKKLKISPFISSKLLIRNFS